MIVGVGAAAAWRLGVAPARSGSAVRLGVRRGGGAGFAPADRRHDSCCRRLLRLANRRRSRAPTPGRPPRRGSAASSSAWRSSRWPAPRLPSFPFDLKPGAANPVAASFLGAAALASALALARAGVHASSRALGVALARSAKALSHARQRAPGQNAGGAGGGRHWLRDLRPRRLYRRANRAHRRHGFVAGLDDADRRPGRDRTRRSGCRQPRDARGSRGRRFYFAIVDDPPARPQPTCSNVRSSVARPRSSPRAP